MRERKKRFLARMTPPTGSRYGQFVYETETMKPLTTERKSP